MHRLDNHVQNRDANDDRELDDLFAVRHDCIFLIASHDLLRFGRKIIYVAVGCRHLNN